MGESARQNSRGAYKHVIDGEEAADPARPEALPPARKNRRARFGTNEDVSRLNNFAVARERRCRSGMVAMVYYA